MPQTIPSNPKLNNLQFKKGSSDVALDLFDGDLLVGSVYFLSPPFPYPTNPVFLHFSLTDGGLYCPTMDFAKQVLIDSYLIHKAESNNG